MSTLRTFFKDTAIYGLSSILPRIINFAFVRVFTSILNTTQFSQQTTWFIYAAFLNVILTMGIETAFLRFYRKSDDPKKVQQTAMVLLVGSSILFCVLGTVFAQSISTVTGINDVLGTRMLVLTTVMDTLVVIPFAYLRVTGRPWHYFAFRMVNIVVLVVAMLMLLVVIPSGMNSASSFFAKPQVQHIFLSNLLASACTLLCLIPLIWKVGLSWDRTTAKELLNYGWPIMVGGLAFVINENLDKMIIPRFIDVHTNGIYSACYKLSVFMTLYITAFRLGAEPFFFTQFGKENAEKSYSQIMTWFVALGGLFMLFVVVFLSFFADIFLRQAVYKTGLAIVPILLVANLFSGIYNNLSIWYKLTDKTRMGMYISIMGAGLTVVSLLVFVPLLGYMGGAWATLVTYATMAIVSYIMGRKWYPIPYEMKKIIVFIGLASLLSYLHFSLSPSSILLGIVYLGIYLVVVGYIQVATLPYLRKKLG